MKGRIKKLFRERGFGFIDAEDGEDVFFHRSDLAGTYFSLLEEGNQVEFDVERGSRSLRAVNIRIIQDLPYDSFTPERTEQRLGGRFDVYARFDSLERQLSEICDHLEKLGERLGRIYERLEKMETGTASQDAHIPELDSELDLTTD